MYSLIALLIAPLMVISPSIKTVNLSWTKGDDSIISYDIYGTRDLNTPLSSWYFVTNTPNNSIRVPSRFDHEYFTVISVNTNKLNSFGYYSP
jgi:hypothetical protein